MRREVLPLPDGVDVEAIAQRCRYVGSPEHKSSPSFAGQPKLRHADATKCDPALRDQADLITSWVSDAIRKGQTGSWDGAFPRYAWYEIDGVCYEARLTNAEIGEYKGYSLERHETPKGL